VACTWRACREDRAPRRPPAVCAAMPGRRRRRAALGATAALLVGGGHAVEVPFGINLFFTEAAEGSSFNRYIEVYNGGLFIAELDQFAFPNVANKPTMEGEWEYWNSFAEGIQLKPGQVYVIAHSSANETILARANETNDYLSNGDDGFQLVYGNETDYAVLDSIGDFMGDPGWGWTVCGMEKATKDHTLVRKSGILAGNSGNWSMSAGMNADDCEWIILPKNNWSDLGKFDGIVNLPTLPPTTTTEEPDDVTSTTTWMPRLSEVDGGLPPSVIQKAPPGKDMRWTYVPGSEPDDSVLDDSASGASPAIGWLLALLLVLSTAAGQHR